MKNYYEERGHAEDGTARSTGSLRDVPASDGRTGQHPGGIVVLPLGEDINSFTPVQHPANDMTTDTITTHFDYHSIDHNLLKLDILGHDDPTMIRMLQDLTGLDPVRTIPLDGQEVMSLFQNTDALGITPEDIGGCKLGALGIPEFGTDFAMQMVIDAKPQVLFRSGAYLRSVPRYGCMAGQCAGPDQERRGDDFRRRSVPVMIS